MELNLLSTPIISRWSTKQPARQNGSLLARGFVHPIRDTKDNLHLFLESKVVHVIFEGTRAVGIEYVIKYT
jgi:hypothetical protein